MGRFDSYGFHVCFQVVFPSSLFRGVGACSVALRNVFAVCCFKAPAAGCSMQRLKLSTQNHGLQFNIIFFEWGGSQVFKSMSYVQSSCRIVQMHRFHCLSSNEIQRGKFIIQIINTKCPKDDLIIQIPASNKFIKPTSISQIEVQSSHALVRHSSAKYESSKD